MITSLACPAMKGSTLVEKSYPKLKEYSKWEDDFREDDTVGPKAVLEANEVIRLPCSNVCIPSMDTVVVKLVPAWIVVLLAPPGGSLSTKKISVGSVLIGYKLGTSEGMLPRTGI
jgi:hypothetical protein